MIEVGLSVSHGELILSALQQVWGFESFKPNQREAVDAVLEGRDSLTVLPTGGGKSLCYQLPAVISKGTAIVISPLISLMEDQVTGLGLLGIPAAFLNSSQTPDDVRRTKAKMFSGELRLLYISPERLLLDHFLNELEQVPLSFFAVDEAHCISQWGHDFRPEYSRLRLLRERFPRVAIHAFTATAPPRVQEEISKDLALNQPEIHIGNYFRSNLKYKVLRRGKLKEQVLALINNQEKGDSGIVYCLTRKETENLSAFLNENGLKAAPYHAGLPNEVRKRHQELFSREKIQVMAATIAFGMGIDQSNIRFVIHAGMPRTLSHYQQETGRAGRDGLPASCTLIMGAKDIQFWKRIIEEEGTLVPTRMAQLQDMIGFATNLRCRHRGLVEHFGQELDRDQCGNCDVCLGEIESIAGSRRYSQMILSAVLKVRQNFGAAHVARVLTGSRDQNVLRNNHEGLSVYGLLREESQYQVHDWINQLIDQGFLQRSGGQYPVIGVSGKGYWLLRPEKFGKKEEDVPVFLVETRKKTASAPTKPDMTETYYDRTLFETLRRQRAELAAELGVPAFMVFGDRSLRDMARKQPTNRQEMLQVFGVGEHKMRRFGEDMIEVIKEHQEGQ